MIFLYPIDISIDNGTITYNILGYRKLLSSYIRVQSYPFSNTSCVLFFSAFFFWEREARSG
uniref:Putative ovule protein n=1 Tax=Solanum chacoense TaxID=4108 RepID=A0A0V0GUV1_SOLCH